MFTQAERDYLIEHPEALDVAEREVDRITELVERLATMDRTILTVEDGEKFVQAVEKAKEVAPWLITYWDMMLERANAVVQAAMKMKQYVQ